MLVNRRIALVSALAAVGFLSACGSGSDSPTTSISVTPGLGAVYGGTVNVYNASGLLLGSGTTSTTTGVASLSLSGYTAGTPVIVKVTLTTGTKYFDEAAGRGAGAEVTLGSGATPVSLLSVAPSVSSGGAVGVTPLTNMAAKLAGLTPSAVTGAALSTPVTSTAIYTAVAKTNLIMGLPTNFNLLSAPTPATATTPNPSDTYGLVLAKMAAASTSALTQVADLASVIKADGTVDTTPGVVAALTTANNALQAAQTALNITVVAKKTTLTDAEVAAAVTAVTATINAGTKPSGSGSGSGGSDSLSGSTSQP